MKLLSGGWRALPRKQAEYARAGIERTDHMVPDVPDVGKWAQWLWVIHDDLPVGLFTLIPLKQAGAAEIGVRFWDENPRNGFFLAGWLDDVLENYPVIIVRCYAKNRKIKRLLQRGGFRLGRIMDDGIEVHSVTRDTYLGTRRKPR